MSDQAKLNQLKKLPWQMINEIGASFADLVEENENGTYSEDDIQTMIAMSCALFDYLARVRDVVKVQNERALAS